MISLSKDLQKYIRKRRTWLALFQQTPTPEEGLYYKKYWFRRYAGLPEHLNLYMSGDFAVTDKEDTDTEPDYTELAVWGVDSVGNSYALDWWSGQTDPLQWVKRWLMMICRWKPRYFVAEGGVIRRAVEPLLRKAMREPRQFWEQCPIRHPFVILEWVSHSEFNKTAAGRPFQAMAENGSVYFPETDWADDVLRQLLTFPAGRFDDKADACANYGRLMEKVWDAREPRTEPEAAEEPQPGEIKIADLLPDDDFERMMGS